ncbi:MAG: hypothetical protein L3J66_03415 [Bacteroidales bacterium]|nr:hypothetical protein [Bacteroidales bacterium]
MKKLLRFFLRFFSLTIFILVAVLVSFYLMAPVYKFSEPKAFRGKNLYNPYRGMDSSMWRRYNFQVQSKAWMGITNGRKNSNELIDSVYRELGFDYVATSDYQKINRHNKNKLFFIPTYEHGYNISRTHQVCIGADEVLWTDFILFQTLSMKQYIIDLLNPQCQIVVLAHPLLNESYNTEDLKYLTNYRMMEVLGNLFLSVEHWDAALSSGQLVWILADDDAHDVLRPSEVGRKFTVINAVNTNRAEIINSLKAGRNYGVDFYTENNVSIAEKAEKLKRLPYLTNAKPEGDTFKVSFSRKAMTIKFIGENGTVRKEVSNAKKASYVIRPDDPYIRTEAMFDYTFTLFLNPVVRYEGDAPRSLKTATVDASATLRLRILYFLFLLGLVFVYAKWRQKKPKL